MNIFINYYTHPNKARQREIQYCLSRNLMHPEFTVYLSEGRVTYDKFFKKINDVTKDDDINIIANADIYFDETIKLAEKIQKDQCYILCRWDIMKEGGAVFYNMPDSQDVWIFRGKVKENIDGNFPLGMMGCDNAIAYRIQQAGYTVLSPSPQIKAYHLHLSDIRNYSNQKRNEKTVVPPPYLTLKFTEI